MQSFFNARYYAKPDGEDYVGKMFATNRLALAFSIPVALTDVVMVSHPKGYLPTIARFGYWMGPAVGMASAFTTGTYAATAIRGKDDTWNYVAGSCAAAGVCGAWQRSPVLGFSMCLFFSIASGLKRLSLHEGWEFFPEPKGSIVSSLNFKKYDYTLTPDPESEKGWSKSA